MVGYGFDFFYIWCISKNEIAVYLIFKKVLRNYNGQKRDSGIL